MLDPILAATRRRIVELDAAELRAAAVGAAQARSLAKALRNPGLQVIAEIKRRSPSAGELAPGLEPAGQARAYVTGGAAAISVLTEPDFFGGSVDDLRAVRAAVDVPVLRKDFVIDPAQIWEAKAAEADAVLLIVAALARTQLADLLGEATEAGLEALVEVHAAAEVEIALAAGAQIIGVNNRDLTTFSTDLATAENVAGLLGPAIVTVAESGVADSAGANRMTVAGYDAILVGEALVRSPDPAALLTSLRSVS